MSDQLLVNIIRVPAAGNLAPGAFATIPHGLKFAGNGVVPNQYLPWNATNIIVNTADDTNVFFQNTDSTPKFAFFRVEYDHSIHAVGTGPLFYRGINGSTSPSGPAGGDLAGNYPNPTVDGFANKPIDTTAPAAGEFWQFDGAVWRHVAVAPGTPTAVYGQFHSSLDQSISNGGTTVVKLENGAGVGVSVVDPGTGPSRITVASAGVYAFTLSAQLFKSAGMGHATVNFWACKGGLDLPDSASFIAVTNNEHSLGFIELIEPMLAGQYIEWCITADKINCTLEHEVAAVGPNAPSVIAGVKLIGI